jgi:hypothetical protein
MHGLPLRCPLAGISTQYLSMIERGERAVDRRSLIVKLANALEIAPSDLIGLPVPAPTNGQADASMDRIRRALMAVGRGRPNGQVVAVEVIRSRVRTAVVDRVGCRYAEVGAVLPDLIRDLHTSIAAGRDVAELLDLAVLLHVQGTAAWLQAMNAWVELRLLATLTARQTAERREDPALLGLAVFHDALMLLTSGDFTLARDDPADPRVGAGLDAVDAPVPGWRDGGAGDGTGRSPARRWESCRPRATW